MYNASFTSFSYFCSVSISSSSSCSLIVFSVLSDTYRKNAYVKCKRQYSFYTCKIKPEIHQNKERQRLMTTLFSIIVFLATSYYTYWLLTQLWKGLSGQMHKVPIFWCCIYIILFNPFFSLVSVSINIIKYRSKSYMDKNKKDTIETVESKIQFALSCYCLLYTSPSPRD